MLNYWRHGSGPTLVLQHGFLGGSRYWTPQILEFGTNFDVIAPDLPGFAGSAQTVPPDTVAGYAAAIVDFLNELGVSRFSFLGHSFGGSIAQQLALDHGDRLEKLVLYGTAPSGDVPTRFETLEDTATRFEQDGLSAGEGVMKSWFVEGEDSPYFHLCAEAGRGATAPAAANLMRALQQWDIRPRLGSVRAPTLVVCGDRDRTTTPAHAYEMWQKIPNASLCVVPWCSHNVHLEQPEVFNRVVREFLFRKH